MCVAVLAHCLQGVLEDATDIEARTDLNRTEVTLVHLHLQGVLEEATGI